MNNAAKNFDILAIGLSVLHNYFDSSTELFSDLHLLAKILDPSAKSSFPRCNRFVANRRFARLKIVQFLATVARGSIFEQAFRRGEPSRVARRAFS